MNFSVTGTGLSTVPGATATLPSATGQGLIAILVQNNASVAPAINGLACWDTAAKATACSATATRVIELVYATPIAISGVNYSQIVRTGTSACTFDASGATVGHWVVQSGTAYQDCADAGTSYPTMKQPLGLAASSVTGSGAAYVFTMNDALPTAPILAEGNVWTGGAQNFAGSAALIVPTPMTIALTTGGSIAYDNSLYRYDLFQDGMDVVPVVSPQGTEGIPTSGASAYSK